mgnify:FL=1
MNKNYIYSLLDEKSLGYKELMNVKTIDNKEKLVALQITNYLDVKAINTEALLNRKIYLRLGAAQKLNIAARKIRKIYPGYKLQIVYGYRLLSIQQKLFQEQKSKLSQQYTGEKLIEATHKYIAVPEIAGHPTGGAIDVQITNNNVPLDFGTKIWSFTNDYATFSPFISKQAWANRQLLRNALTQVGIAPFDGEWWHFSYGDKEWASYYNNLYAIYEQIQL